VKAPRTIKFTAYLLGFVGAALLTGPMISQGAADLIRAVASIGWGLVAISGLHIAKLLSDTIGWLIEGSRLWQTHSFPVDPDSHRFTHVPTRTCR
jgi:hypothetical protein